MAGHWPGSQRSIWTPTPSSSRHLDGGRTELARTMITIRTGLEQRAHRRGEVVDERHLRKGAALPRHAQDKDEGELVTYVRGGSLRCQDQRGQSTMLHAGEFQRMTVGPSVRHDETNG